MRTDDLPSFIVIGAVKAATTWISHQLQQQPSIFLPGPEPHYFSSEYERGLGWYRGWFKDARPGQVIGEKSADYLADVNAPGRIAALLPAARLIAQLRNPIERAYSDYCMLYRRGTVGADPERYLTQSSPESSRFLQGGLYASHLARFLDHFAREQLLLVLHDDITRRPEAMVAEVCRHIGVEAQIKPAELARRVKDSETPSLPLSLRRALRPFKQMAAPMRGQAWFKSLHGLLARPTEYPPLTPKLRQRLQDFYFPDIQKLEKLLGRDMSLWLTAEASATGAA